MAEISSEWLKTASLDLHYLRAGSGPAVVLLHGWPEFSGVWKHNIPALAEHHDVIAPDLRTVRTHPATGPGRRHRHQPGGAGRRSLRPDGRARHRASRDRQPRHRRVRRPEVCAPLAGTGGRACLLQLSLPGYRAGGGRLRTTCARSGTSRSTSSRGRPSWSATTVTPAASTCATFSPTGRTIHMSSTTTSRNGSRTSCRRTTSRAVSTGTRVSTRCGCAP